MTYNLHVLLRFELENDLLEGRLSVADAPQAWAAKTQEYLGLTPENDAQGILQDVHWSGGSFGYFPTYTVGNLLSVQLFDKANEDLGGEVAAQIARGDFGRCSAGCARTSTSGAASTTRPPWSAAPSAARSTPRRTCATCKSSTGIFMGCRDGEPLRVGEPTHLPLRGEDGLGCGV